MNFLSSEFFLFMCVVFFAFYLTPFKFRWFVLLAGSLFFYGYLNPYYLILLIIPTVIVYVIALRFEPQSSSPEDTGNTNKKKWLIVGITAAIMGLVIYKYTDFLGSSVYGMFKLFNSDITYTPFNWLLPIGISFYTFKLLSYLVDVYNEKLKPERHLGYFALYVSFFPQILAGPIERATNFIPELKKNVSFDIDRILDGLKLVAWGAFKKLVIADQLTPAVDRVYNNVKAFEGPDLLAASIFFSIQIYCDFSGYSDMAIGLARVFGFKSMDNFKAPYFSRNVRKFWNRWHISLSTWLRDYLFLPITYAVFRRVKSHKPLKMKIDTFGYIIGMSITMFLGGLWHGADWTFVLWGMIHAVFLVGSYTTKKIRKRFTKRIGLKKFPNFHRRLSTFITFCMVSFAWIFFRANSIEDAFYVCSHLHVGTFDFITDIVGKLVSQFNIGPLKTMIVSYGFSLYNFFFLSAAVVAMMVLERNQDKQDFWVTIKAKPVFVRFVYYYLLVMAILLFAKTDGGSFIYFQF
jgi:alginate O-acetyltransferase complex protein AlgI